METSPAFTVSLQFGARRSDRAHARISGTGIRISRIRKQGFTSLSSSVCRIPVPSTIARLQTISEGTAIVKARGRVTGVSATTSGRSSPSPLPRWRKDLPAGAATRSSAHTDRTPSRSASFTLEVRCKKGDGDGHPSLR